MRKLTMIVVHCTASRCTSTLTPAALTTQHRHRGFTSCGYHYYITRNGDIHPMRDVSEIGAHVRGCNAYSIGVAYEGGLDAAGKPADTRTDEQKASLISLLRYLKETYPEIVLIIGHRDLSPDLNRDGKIEPKEWVKVCPCFNASAEYKHLLTVE